ncbi:hypothetical protein SY83_12010 [Paenibacillus swuensis]|uniref:HrgC protein n=1 Tax=Paenibacillus swuensis TaxID=1178515 RepID=A0A172TIT7_9BACL|nr:hypothetical protein [Paenibacillus swuensis]ANE46882.1 hypothetical protein SY83_12010 [Paenibacillus swuensis]
MVVQLKNQVGMVKQAKIGFSWTTFFFGFFPALFRGDWKWCIIQLLAASFTLGLTNLVFSFIYNKLYINGLLENGYVPADSQSEAALVASGFIASGMVTTSLAN